jgi:uncharacterized protein YacL
MSVGPGDSSADPQQPAVAPSLTAPAAQASVLSNSPAALASADASADTERAKLGVLVVIAGLAVILIGFVLAVLHYHVAGDAATALASITGVVGTIVGAYFGVQVGSQGKASAEAARTHAENQAKALATVAPKADAAAILGLPVPPSTTATAPQASTPDQ